MWIKRLYRIYLIKCPTSNKVEKVMHVAWTLAFGSAFETPVLTLCHRVSLCLEMPSHALVSISWPCSTVDPHAGHPPAVLHEGFLLAGGQAPCDVHCWAIKGIAEWAVRACSLSQWAPEPRCWWLCPATWCAAGAKGSGGGIHWVATLVWHRLSTTCCYKEELTGHKLARRTSWCFRSTGHFPTLTCWV